MAAQSIDGFIDPKDIAQLAVLLASDAAKSISGQVIPIDKDRQKATAVRRLPGPKQNFYGSNRSR
jgi:NAD(P)-dependent dehydrogenase (short-subunit alcohol dehydrogenase family)